MPYLTGVAGYPEVPTQTNWSARCRLTADKSRARIILHC